MSATVFQLSEHAAHAQQEWAGEAHRIRLGRSVPGVRHPRSATVSLVQRFATALSPVRSAGQPCTGTC